MSSMNNKQLAYSACAFHVGNFVSCPSLINMDWVSGFVSRLGILSD